MSKKKDKINQVKLEFISNSSVSVTGSALHASFFDKSLNREVQILIELGASQEGSKLDCYNINTKLLEELDVKNLDYVIILHQHNDHASLVPFLTTNHNFKGKVITTKESIEILPIMWADSCYINDQDIEFLKKSRKGKDRVFKPYYKMQDVDAIKEYMMDIPVNKIINLTNNFQIRFIENKHTLASVSCELFFKDTNSRVHKLFYSSDLGNVNNTYFVSKYQNPPKSSNVSIYESTYGKRDRLFEDKKLRKKELEILERTIVNTILRGGSVLSACFAFQRTPSMAIDFIDIIERNKCLSDIEFVIDGKLTNGLLDIFERICKDQDKVNIDKILNFKNLVRIRSYKETVKLIDDKKPRIIISSSGMMQAGHVLEYAKYILPNKRNSIIFCGYSPEGSLASKIKEKDETHQKTVKIDKSIVIMNCDVVTLNSFSSHIQRNDLINYILNTNTSDYIAFIHGSADAKQELAEDVCKRLEDNCCSTKVIIPKKNQVLYF